MQIFNKIQKFFQKKTFGLSGLLPEYNLRSQPWSGKPLDAYYIDLYVNKALDKRGSKVGQINFTVEKNGEEINDPILKILKKPNKYFYGPDFWKMYQIILDIYGEAYIWVEYGERSFGDPKNIIGLHLLNPGSMRVKMNDVGEIEGYRKEGKDKSVFYKPDEILRRFRPDPGNINSLKGLSLLQAGKNNIHTNIQLSQHQANIIKNGGKVEGVFKFKTEQGLTRDQLREIKDKYKNEYAEARRAGMPLFLGGDSEYIRTGLTPAELSYLESKKVTLTDICILTEVPEAVLVSVNDIKYSNAETVYRIFLLETIKPLVDDLTSALTAKFFSEDKEGRIVSYKEFVPESREEKRKDLETADKINALTINEKRNELGFEPVANGDKILIPFSLVDLSNIDKKESDKKEEKVIKTAEFDHPLRDYYVRRKYFDWKIKKLDKKESEMTKELDSYFSSQLKRLTEKIKSIHVFRKKDLIDENFNIDAETELAFNEFLPLLEKFLLASGQESLDFINYPYKFLLSSEIKSWLDGKVEVFAKQINETTFEKLKKEFAESLESGEGRDDLVNRIRGVYGNISESRAATIARTEVLGVTQKGTFEAYKQAMIPIKIWSSIIDGRTRHNHISLDGEERPIGVPFSNGLDFPGDPSGPAGEIVNCRCVI